MNWEEIKEVLAKACGERNYASADAVLQTAISQSFAEAISYINQITNADELANLLSFNTIEPTSITVNGSEGDSVVSVDTADNAFNHQMLYVNDSYYEIISVDTGVKTLTINGNLKETLTDASGKVYYFRYWPTLYDVRKIISAKYRTGYCNILSSIHIASFYGRTGRPQAVALSSKVVNGKRAIVVWPFPDDVYKLDLVVRTAIADITSDDSAVFYPEEALHVTLQYAKILLFELGYKSVADLQIANEAFMRKLRAYNTAMSNLRSGDNIHGVAQSDDSDLIERFGYGQ